MQPAHQLKRRSFLLLLLLTLIWGGLLLRLWWIQLGSPHHFSEHGIDLIKNAVRQRQQSIVLHSGRGDILDRNGKAFTGVEQQALILFPIARGGMEGTDNLRKIAGILRLPEEQIAGPFAAHKGPFILRNEEGAIIALSSRQADQINRLGIPGVIALPVTERYQKDEVAKQVIGYVNQNPSLIKSLYRHELEQGKMSLDTAVGASGLERSFDRFLQGEEPSTLSYFVDGMGNPLRGLDIRHTQQENQFYPLSLVTTLDKSIQRRLEQTADQQKLKEGAIVVLDVKSGDVLAMVSRPQYDQTQVRIAEGGWQNHAVKQMPPGSVFKTVVAAAALGEGLVSPTERFHCDGEYGKYGFSCWKEEGHGSITLEEAFAHSCNIAFAQIAKRVGGDTIEEYAHRLGLGVRISHETPHLYKLEKFRQIEGEENGTIFAAGNSRDDEGVLIQTAIGQRDVRITPLQAANMMATILREGRPGQVRLVSDITYRNGLNFHHFPVQSLPQEGIDKVTAKKLKHLLEKVVEEGTGKALQGAAWPVAGKSGTAQVSKAGESRNHHWFVGYAPADNPRYAIAVVAENQPVWTSHGATGLFRRVVDDLAALQGQSAAPPEANRSE
ncbi:peptidoglycan D,D-transpeptidase FtsI family protein [Brevibacillus sp. H7]|uniref:peptidoglycan D,D-transpeptidase FtsI family protein n=1 Tax=Brevibacillus sp. H7 TaxID=3349138 RepID=UPI00381A5E43